MRWKLLQTTLEFSWSHHWSFHALKYMHNPRKYTWMILTCICCVSMCSWNIWGVFCCFFSNMFGPWSRSERLGGYAMVFNGEESEASDGKRTIWNHSQTSWAVGCVFFFMGHPSLWSEVDAWHFQVKSAFLANQVRSKLGIDHQKHQSCRCLSMFATEVTQYLGSRILWNHPRSSLNHLNSSVNWPKPSPTHRPWKSRRPCWPRSTTPRPGSQDMRSFFVCTDCFISKSYVSDSYLI